MILNTVFLWVGVASVALAQTQATMPQPVLQQAVTDMGTDRMINSVSQVFDYRTIATKGSPYYDEAWLPGEVTIGDRTTRYSGQLKLDVLNNRLLMKRPQGDSVWVPTGPLRTITLNPLAGDSRTIRFRHFAEAKFGDPAINESFLRVLHEGDYGTLVQWPIRRLYKARPNDPYNHSPTTEEIRDEPVYYVIRPDHSAEKIKFSRRAVADAMGPQGGPQFEAYLKAQSLPARSAHELAAALQSFAGLVR
jgi:hypothetical protein